MIEHQTHPSQMGRTDQPNLQKDVRGCRKKVRGRVRRGREGEGRKAKRQIQ